MAHSVFLCLPHRGNPRRDSGLRSEEQQEPSVGTPQLQKRWPRWERVCLLRGTGGSASVGNRLFPEDPCCARDKAGSQGSKNKKRKKKKERKVKGAFELFHCLLLLYSGWGLGFFPTPWLSSSPRNVLPEKPGSPVARCSQPALAPWTILGGTKGHWWQQGEQVLPRG